MKPYCHHIEKKMQAGNLSYNFDVYILNLNFLHQNTYCTFTPLNQDEIPRGNHLEKSR